MPQEKVIAKSPVNNPCDTKYNVQCAKQLKKKAPRKNTINKLRSCSVPPKNNKNFSNGRSSRLVSLGNLSPDRIEFGHGPDSWSPSLEYPRNWHQGKRDKSEDRSSPCDPQFLIHYQKVSAELFNIRQF